MKSKDVNKAIRQAFTHAAPNVLDSVLSECETQKGTVIVMTEKKKVHWGIKLAAAAAMLALIIGIGFGAGTYRLEHRVVTTVSLDVNPSVELRVNRQERVLEALALNEDARTVLDGMDLDQRGQRKGCRCQGPAGKTDGRSQQNAGQTELCGCGAGPDRGTGGGTEIQG